MATTITMPQLGETVTEGTVAQWLKKAGDSVEKYEAFLEVSTDKVNAEVPSPVTGTIRELLIKEGETVPTGTAIAIIDEVGAASGATAAVAAPTQHAAHATDSSHSAGVGASKSPVPGQSNAPSTFVPTTTSNGASHAVHNGSSESVLRGCSPAVRRLAREHHIDVAQIKGTGANGRVTAEDVMTAASMGPAAAVGQAIAVGQAAPPAPSKPAPPSGTSTYGEPIPGTTIPLNQARKIIAQRMVESKHNAPHAWSMVEVDVTNLWKWRAREKDAFMRDNGYSLTLLPFFIRAVVESIAAFPLMNAKFTDEGLYVNKDVNIGIAIGLATNLVVPVVKHADQLSIKGIARAAGELIDKARRNKLGVDDLQGGTFTVNNNGANGSYASAPIINGGQAGIVTMEAVVKKPVVTKDDSIAIRSMMNVCLSLDHRVVDGYVASGFLADLKKRLEAMGPLGTL
ncbi:MAG: 2-oxo acid dehydrogenase subunit E2 [Candidatus Eremiobacteraeota bacterium]|nr:2-oxo acid dehydrogenase subunit E2 [Candidatus Eremiobacteraeota bacterium]